MTAVQPRFDTVVHPPPRLQICGLLAAVDSMDFAAVRDAVGVSDSVLSKHVKQLEEAGYVAVGKATIASRQRTSLALTPQRPGGLRRARRRAPPDHRRRPGAVNRPQEQGEPAMDGGRRPCCCDWAAVLAVGVVAGRALLAVGVPSAPLFGGLVAGLGRALLGRGRLTLPRPAGIGAQAVIGVSIGALVQTDTLRTVAEHWLPVLLVTVGTLLVSLAAGQLMRLQRGVSPVTGAFSMIAGGASGITAMARDLGADEQMVAVLQYLRVLLIVVAMPIVATTVYGASAGVGAAPAGGGAGLAGRAAVHRRSAWSSGLLLGRLIRLPVGGAARADGGGRGPGPHRAGPGRRRAGAGARPPAFLAIGLQVGLSFTRASLRLVGRALPLALALIVGRGRRLRRAGRVLVAARPGSAPLDGYLATTPGGLYAVLATATGSGADATFVLSVQVLRLFVMLLLRPAAGPGCCVPGGG